MDNKTKMSAPWVRFYRELEALFSADPDVTVHYYDDKNEVKLFVDDSTKAEALSKLLPNKKNFGNVELLITVVPANDTYYDKVKLFKDAFYGNPNLKSLQYIDILSNPITYLVFKKEVVQYYNDDLGDVNGICSTLYQDIAKNIFGEVDGVFFCTDVE